MCYRSNAKITLSSITNVNNMILFRACPSLT